MRIYWQIQGKNADGESYHSDGCSPLDGIDRGFIHALVDEWLDKAHHSAGELSDDILEGAHFVLSAGCCEDYEV